MILFLLIVNILLTIVLVIYGIYVNQHIINYFKSLESNYNTITKNIYQYSNNIHQHIDESTSKLNEKSATNYNEIVCLHEYIESLEARLISNFRDIKKYFADAKDCLATINSSIYKVESEMQLETKSKERYANVSSKLTRIKEDTTSIGQYITEINKKISLQSENVLNSIKTLKTSKSTSKPKKSIIDEKK